jgi:sugar/nucleoside kinase (ribokinase family)
MFVSPALSPKLGQKLPNRIICYGDVIDDIVVVPKLAIREDTDTPAVIRSRPGGSAANTAAWLGAIEAPVDLVGVVGRGDAERHRAALAGVECHFREHASLQTGRIVIVVQNERRDMLTDRGANADLSPDDISPTLLQQAQLVHFTGHVILNTDGYARVRTLIERCRAAGVLVSVSPGSVGYIRDVGVERARRAFAGADIVFAGLEDGMLLAGKDDPTEAAAALSESFEVAIVTRGGQGLSVGERGSASSVDIEPLPTIDPTGAGDAFSAGFLENWVSTGNVQSAVEAGIDLAAEAVGVMGGRPV